MDVSGEAVGVSRGIVGVSRGIVGAGNGSNCLDPSRRVGKTEVRHRQLAEALAVLRPSELPWIADGERPLGLLGEW